MNTVNTPVFTAQANSGTVYSSAIDARFIQYATVQAEFTDSAAAGTLALQGSNDPISPSNWSAIPGYTATVSAGATTTTAVPAQPLSYQFIRVSWVSTGGAGTLTANLHGWGQ
jgi:hypothetical protein